MLLLFEGRSDREAGASSCGRTGLGGLCLYQPVPNTELQLNRPHCFSWTLKPQSMWIVAREEANLRMCRPLQGQEGVRETPFLRPKLSFKLTPE